MRAKGCKTQCLLVSLIFSPKANRQSCQSGKSSFISCLAYSNWLQIGIRGQWKVEHIMKEPRLVQGSADSLHTFIYFLLQCIRFQWHDKSNTLLGETICISQSININASYKSNMILIIIYWSWYMIRQIEMCFWLSKF